MKKLGYPVVVVLVLLMSSVSAQSQSAASDSNLTLLGYLPIGSCEAVASLNQRYAVIGSGRGIRILDVADPTHPVMASEVTSGGEVSDVFVSGDYIYFTTKGTGYYSDEHFTAGLTIVDASDPLQPVVQSFYSTNDRCYAVLVVNQYAYVSSGSQLLVIDISNPAAPAKVSEQYLGQSASNFACDGQYLYVPAQSAGLQIFSLSDPAHPSKVGALSNTFAGGVVVRDTIAVLTGDLFKVRICSVHDPANPFQLSEIPSENNVDSYYSTFIDGSRLYISGTHRENTAQFMLKIYDITNPRAPVLKSMYWDSTKPSGNTECGVEVLVADQIAYVAVRTGLRLVQVSDVENPASLSAYYTSVDPSDLYISNDVAFFAFNVGPVGMAGFSILDVSNPSCLRERGHIYLQPPVSGNPAIAITKNRAYVAQPVDAPDSARGLHVIDVSDPGNPHQSNFVRLSHVTKNVIAAAGNFVYMQTTNMDTIRVFDVSDPDHPALIANFFVSPWDYGFVSSYLIAGDHLYVGTTKGLMILNRSNSGGLAMAGFYALPTSGWLGVSGIAVADSQAYLATDYGLIVVDVSNPLEPTAIATTPGNLYDVALLDGEIYVADGGRGIVSYRLTNGDSLEKTGYFNTKNFWPRKVATANGLIYAAYEGLMIFRKGPATDVATERTALPGGFELVQNYPNPFNPVTHIQFSVAKRTRVRISVYNSVGQLVERLVDEVKPAGVYRINWRASHLESGVYFIRMEAGNSTQVRKAVLLK